MLHFYPSNYTEHLASVVAHIMDRQPLKGVFEQEIVLVQSHGMGTWLQQQISKELGIAAMIQTQMPASFIWRFAEKVLPEDQLVPLFEKANLRWHLMQLLPAKLEDPRYAVLADYLNSGKSGQQGNESRLFDLCEQLADVFDAYQNYRPDWIASWERQERWFRSGIADNLSSELEAWQADLWHSLYSELDTEARRHRPIVLEKLKQTLSHANPQIKAWLPERVFVFGLSALPPQWLPLFELLGQHIDIHFLALNPCRQYWGDIQTEPQQLAFQQTLIEQGIDPDIAAESVYEANSLLASWGRLGRDYVSLIAQSQSIQEISADLYEAPETQHALGALQFDILSLESPERRFSDDDQSMRFARCHNRLREVEALHDYLLSLLDTHSSLAPKDIIVMMPDVQDYAALIEAVFSRPAMDTEGRIQHLPYAVSDQSVMVDQPLIEVITQLFQLPTLRMTASEILDWLEVEAIRQRFDIDEEDLPVIRHWVQELAVRWGLSSEHRDQILNSHNAQASNTWLNAIRRVLAGVVMGCQPQEQGGVLSAPDGTILPFALNDRDQQKLAGKLIRFIDVIERSVDRLSGKKNVDEWLQVVQRLWQDWLDEGVLGDSILQMLDKVLTDVREQVLLVGFTADIALDVVAKVISSHFEKERVSQRFLAGRINFCTLMPMRSIPFKAVCLIGMNEGDYPRQETKMSFDLMSITPGRTGDRSRRSDDRYLFLEALCSARENLYISYCAYDARDNSERFPSLLVSELREYLSRYYALDGSLSEEPLDVLDAWTTDHRLQPFHADYFQPDSAAKRPLPQSYCLDWLSLHNEQASDAALKRESHVTEDQVVQPIELEAMVQCANHPLRHYYQKTLGLRFFALEEALEEVEPFNLNYLDSFELKRNLISTWSDASITEQDVLARWELSDRLPKRDVADLYLAGLQADVVQYKDYMASYGELMPLSASIPIDGVVIEGDFLSSVQGQIVFTLNRNISGRFFGAWVKHVAWNCAAFKAFSQTRETYLISPETVYRFEALAPEKAERYLTELIMWYQRALRDACLFLPKTAFEQLFGSLSSIQTAFRGWQNASASGLGEMDDLYWQRACSLGTNPIDSQTLPAFDGLCLFEQVREQLESDGIRKLENEGAPS